MSTYLTQQDVDRAVQEALRQAELKATEFFQDKLEGQDQFPCGFAWCDITGVKGSTKLGKMLIKAGFEISYHRTLQMWNPSRLRVQNVYCLEQGAAAFAKVIKDRLGVDAFMSSRWD